MDLTVSLLDSCMLDGLTWYGRVPATDLLTAFHDWFEGVPTLTAAFPGGCWIGRAPADLTMPCCVVSQIAGVAVPDTASSRVRRVEVQCAAFAAGRLAASNAGAALWNAFAPTPEAGSRLTYDGGREIGRVPLGEGLELDPDPGPAGEPIWQKWFSFLLFVESP